MDSYSVLCGRNPLFHSEHYIGYNVHEYGDVER